MKVLIQGIREHLSKETHVRLEKVAGVTIIHRGHETDLEIEDSELALKILEEKCGIFLTASKD